jgi:cytochrome c peroxidase
MKLMKSYVNKILVISLAMLAGTAQALTPEDQLGKSIFFDQNLSIKNNQACASCHDPKVGGTGAIPGINHAGAVYRGSIKTRFGNRKPPSSAYASTAPIFGFSVVDGMPLFRGGNFWDGRATGEKLGNPAADQAQGPFLNPVEQALPDAACVVYRVCNPKIPTRYPVKLTDVWGTEACAIDWPVDTDNLCADGLMIDLDPVDRDQVNTSYDQIALSIAAYEGSPEVNQYSSKYDAYLIGQAELTAEEMQGLELFVGDAKCSACHVLTSQENGDPPLLTDYSYDNLGVPRNPDNPWYESELNPQGFDWVDPGLGGFLTTRPDYVSYAAENMGKHKVPTLRNVDLRPGMGFTKAYMHNGYFKSLEAVVSFYNTRDVKPVCPDPFTSEADALANGCWPVPEVSDNLNMTELGNLGLTSTEEAALVAFLKTLSDGYTGP